MARTLTSLAMLLLVAGACSGSSEESPGSSTAGTAAPMTSAAPDATAADTLATTSVPTTAAPTTTGAPATTATTAATTTTTSTARPAPTMLVSNQQGVFELAPDGSQRHLLEGQIEYAVDDTRGGVVFQLQRGFGPFSSRVWRVPAGGTFADPILIADPDTQSLTLHDVVADGAGTFIFYTRRDRGLSEEQNVATLRQFDLDERVVEELAPAGGFESGARPISFGGGLFVLNWGAEGFVWIEFLDRDGDPVDIPGNPLPEELGAFDCAPCAQVAELSPDGRFLVYEEAVLQGDFYVPTLVLIEMPDGAEVARVNLEDGLIHSLDYVDGYVVVSRLSNDFFTFRTPLLVDFSQPEPTISELPLEGLARIVRAPIDIEEPVLAPVTDG